MDEYTHIKHGSHEIKRNAITYTYNNMYNAPRSALLPLLDVHRVCSHLVNGGGTAH